MKKIIKKFREFREWFEEWLRGCCARMTPQRRLMTIIVIGTLFAAINLYITIRAIYEIGRQDAYHQMMEIRHIEAVKIPKPTAPEKETDLNTHDYDNN